MAGAADISNGGNIRPSMQAALSTAAALASVVHSDPQQYPSVLASAPIPIVPAGVTTAPAPIAPATKQSMHHYSYPTSHQQPQPMHTQPPMFQAQQQTKKSVFENMKLRRGKWTAEEEAYADVLIKEFEKGTVEGCENGCTLRSFLSRKLHCAPMRISKKYAGKSIGKHVFLSRSSGVSPIVDQKDTTNYKAKLQELEMKFHKSLFQETEAANSLMAFVPQPVSSSYPVQVLSSTPTAYPSHGTYVSYPQQQQPPVWLMSKNRNDQQQSHNQLHHQTNQLHQTFLSALNQTSPPAGQKSNTPATAIAPGGPPKAPESVAHLAPIAQAQYPQGRKPGAHPYQGIPVARQVHKIPPPAAPLQPIAPKTPSYHDPGSMDIPDFLSGFDKVAAAERSKKEQLQATNTVHIQSSEYSPPFTSRSFDDLHQHLGKGLSPRPFDLNNTTGYPQPSALGSSQRPVTADSYAIFAQQSALAVSQHSAYKQESIPSIPFPTLSASVTDKPRLPTMALTPSVVNAANLRAHSMANSESNIVSGSEKSSEWGTEGSESTAVSSTGCRSGSDTTDNHSDNLSNDSDSNSLEGPQKKKAKVQ